MSRLRFALGSILLASSSVAWGQGSPERAYPMNTLDRINGVSSGGYAGSYDDDRPIGAAGAFPMNTIDRINSGWRNNLNTTDRVHNPQPQPNTVRTGVSAGATSLKDRPDAWRYVRHENRWWYYGADNQWLYWTGNRWNALQSASADKN